MCIDRTLRLTKSSEEMLHAFTCITFSQWRIIVTKTGHALRGRTSTIGAWRALYPRMNCDEEIAEANQDRGGYLALDTPFVPMIPIPSVWTARRRYCIASFLHTKKNEFILYQNILQNECASIDINVPRNSYMSSST